MVKAWLTKLQKSGKKLFQLINSNEEKNHVIAARNKSKNCDLNSIISKMAVVTFNLPYVVLTILESLYQEHMIVSRHTQVPV